MAGRKAQEGRKSSLKTIEAKIDKAKDRVVKTKAAYEAAMKDLRELMDKRDLLRQDALMKLVMNSKRSYEEIEAFLKSDPSDQD